MARKYRTWAIAIFTLYCLMMLWLLYGQRWGQSAGGLNLKPFDTMRRFCWVLRYSHDRQQLRHAIVNLGGNVAMFVPLGFLVPCIWQKMQKFWRHILLMTAIILTVELLQLISGLGTCDVDDLLLNLVGTTLGFLCLKGWNRLRS